MDAPVVDVRALRKVYRVTERETGLAATLRSIVKRRYREVLAVDGITFRIDPGEVVGFSGRTERGRRRRSRCCRACSIRPAEKRRSWDMYRGAARATFCAG
jgi:ABC-type sugar transport system ATPase subunit